MYITSSIDILLPMYILSSLSLKIFSQNIRNTRWTNIYETIMFQSLMPAVILETFAISKNKFSVTNKNKLEENRMYKFSTRNTVFYLYGLIYYRNFKNVCSNI